MNTKARQAAAPDYSQGITYTPRHGTEAATKADAAPAQEQQHVAAAEAPAAESAPAAPVRHVEMSSAAPVRVRSTGTRGCARGADRQSRRRHPLSGGGTL